MKKQVLVIDDEYGCKAAGWKGFTCIGAKKNPLIEVIVIPAFGSIQME